MEKAKKMVVKHEKRE